MGVYSRFWLRLQLYLLGLSGCLIQVAAVICFFFSLDSIPQSNGFFRVADGVRIAQMAQLATYCAAFIGLGAAMIIASALAKKHLDDKLQTDPEFKL